MRTPHWILLIGFVTSVSAAVPARAQDTAVSPTPPADHSSDPSFGDKFHNSQWSATGFAGSILGGQSSSPSVEFGGEIAYQYRSWIGGEFLADFAPNFKVDNVFLVNNPAVNTYMGNVIAGIPIGHWLMLQPYVSAGAGAVQTRSDIFNIATFAQSGVNNVSDLRPGFDVGAGVKWFAGRVGVRADIRYYRTFTTGANSATSASAASVFGSQLFSAFSFWHANLGVAVRW